MRLIHGDCLTILPTLESASVDSVITDPPSGISFMGKGWDSFRAKDAFIDYLALRLVECRRVVRPGAFMLCWALPRTSHWTGLAIEEAGWAIRDRITHLFGQGFPKSQSCLKPAAEDWWLAKAQGGLRPLNIDACRIPTTDVRAYPNGPGGKSMHYSDQTSRGKDVRPDPWALSSLGRWPANLVLDEEAAALLDEQSGQNGRYSPINAQPEVKSGFGDKGGASRFFYTAKASRSERGDGNSHPTVKPLALMRWLVRLITPPGGTVLDPFLGSGTTALACLREGRQCVGIEQNPDYLAIARKRLADEYTKTPLFEMAAQEGM